jgi:hypothetical protein
MVLFEENKMPGATFTVFEQMRPPVVVDFFGKSPLRTKNGKQVFEALAIKSPKN